jgi:hypothetical protein
MSVFSLASCKHFLLRREEQVARRFVFSAVVKYAHRLFGFGLALPALLNDTGVLRLVAVVFVHVCTCHVILKIASYVSWVRLLF